jgi:hypothetical protein
MRIWGPLVAVLILASVTPASAECAWILWVEYGTMGTRETTYERRWVPESAYPGDGYTQCLADVRDRAAQYAANSQTAEGVQKTLRIPLHGGQEKVTNYLRIGNHSRVFACFPHPIKPE